MSDRMRPIPFPELMEQLLADFNRDQSVLGIRAPYRHTGDKKLEIFGEKLETPFGPAAGPHTQLAQNLIAAYAGGARFFELKTVQKIDGEDLPVSKPCILAAAEGYNVEWSTELTVPQAFDEYVKAWFALKLIGERFGLGAADGFVFNMSVGYDLAGIRTEKIDRFIEGLKDARNTPVWRECADWANRHLGSFPGLTQKGVDAIDAHVCKSITLSTLHGCPPEEIERIATYLIKDKHLNTFVKCNPTLLGYNFARRTLDALGYEDVAFDDHHFKDDLQLADAVPMFTRLMTLAQSQGVAFGLKLSNTFPVNIARGELPGEEMYMSGKALWPLTVHLAEMLEKAFGGQIRVSYSGGADEHNIAELVACGIWPVTLATTLLKPGGYNRLPPIARKLAAAEYRPFTGVDIALLSVLAEKSLTDPRYRRPLKPSLPRKNDQDVPLLDCSLAPCSDACPIHQDISAYMELAAQGRYTEALKVICDKNALPSITGTICNHRCMSGCTRNQYDTPLHIRDVKLEAAQKGYEPYLDALAPAGDRPERVAVVGGGPAGMAVAYFLARAGAKVTIFEAKDALGGLVRHVIPEFRIPCEAVDRDAAMLKKLGVNIIRNTRAETAQTLLENGFTHVALCCGAQAHGTLGIPGEVNAIAFLEQAKKYPDTLVIGKHIVVAGAGDTAMDAARAAKRVPGVEDVTIVYRRTKRQMPADEEELDLALAEDIAFVELLSPKTLEAGTLTCEKMRLGDPDESGRRSPEPTGETVKLPCDTLVAAVGEKPDEAQLFENGVKLTPRGRPTARKQSERVYVLGDALRGPATVVEAIADAQATAEDILGVHAEGCRCETPVRELLARRGAMQEPGLPENEFNRCLGCDKVCLNCVDVCPNRANETVWLDGNPQIVHIDGRCNECGNCATFCPYKSAPYLDKLTFFADEQAFRDSHNPGWAMLGDDMALIRLNGSEFTAKLTDPVLPADIAKLMRETIKQMPWLVEPPRISAV
ncbi:MAG: putative selenate reductase subunit YgfK [Eubacteriales bacterium]|nr:putative selenate reductase subunit YgfK [Eubacteriales bacterium]